MKNTIYKYWNEHNQEGLRRKDCFYAICFVLTFLIVFANLTLWLSKPEQDWIGKLIFPLK